MNVGSFLTGYYYCKRPELKIEIRFANGGDQMVPAWLFINGKRYNLTGELTIPILIKFIDKEIRRWKLIRQEDDPENLEQNLITEKSELP